MGTNEMLNMLIIGENESDRKALSKIFKSDYGIIEKENYDEAAKEINRYKIDVVIADVKFIVQLKNNRLISDIPIIAMIKAFDDDSGAVAIDSGAYEFITKPFNQTVVYYRVQNIVKHFEQERNLREMRSEQITEMHRYIEIDSLTGLINRETFYKRAAALMQDNVDTKYYIIYLDISCFKAINDLFHIETGNLILRTAANYFTSTIVE